MKTAYYWSCFARCVLGACLAAAVASAYAQQSYPTRPVRIIVPSSAGGGTDTTTRLVSNKLGEFLGQRVVIENRAGAASIVGSEIVARSAPDGYTLLAAISTITINPSVHKSLPYDAIRGTDDVVEEPALFGPAPGDDLLARGGGRFGRLVHLGAPIVVDEAEIVNSTRLVHHSMRHGRH